MSLNFNTPAPTRTLLLVDDDKNILITLRMFLQRQGWHLLEAETVAAAMKLWEANHQYIDAVVTDYSFGTEATGMDLVTFVQLRERGFPCVVMSAAWSPEKRPRDEPRANLYYRAKPLELRQLLELINNMSRSAATA